MTPHFRNLAVWVIILVLLAALYNMFQTQPQGRRAGDVSYSEFLNAVEQDKVAEVTITGNRISGVYRDSASRFQTFAPEDPQLVERLRKKDIRFTARPPDEDMPWLLSALISWLPMLLIIGIWLLFMRQMQSGSGRAMGFGKSRAKLLTERQGRVTFEDVAGVDEAKVDLQEIVEFLRDPQKFQRLGGRIPRGCLLV
ncbi:MAG TPA: ATP-dependent metallopeptidase FtsH/Yme1/Tma family protein, partial [Hyphomicrobiaceae bacterium]|nr:ATP-dependent metallopeptidase FtsH/Yme1/Tma family protein [Hyphomicrobiaceae bacterium]